MVTIGRVISTATTPSLDKIDFVLDKYVKHQIERGMFVAIHDEREVTILGLITGILKQNSYFESTQLNILVNPPREFDAIFPTKEWDVVMIGVKPLGEIQPNTLKVSRMKYPVSPGSKVVIASSSQVSSLLGLNADGLFLGVLDQNQVEIRPDFSRLLRKHIAILAISGAGKSYAASILLEELYSRGTAGVLVIDPHGEYSQIISSWNEKKNVEIIDGSFISIGVPELSAWEISEFIPEISSVQTRILGGILADVKKQKTLYGIQDIIKQLEVDDMINIRTKEALTGWLHSLSTTYLFSSNNSPNFSDLISPGKIVVVDLSKISNIRSRRIITLHFLKNLYQLRTQNLIPPLIFVIEEAHQFCPERSRSVSKRIIETIAREGRKFFASLCLISQRPVNMSVTALSQCNTNLVLRIRNPYDLDFIGRTSESIDRSALNMLPSLDIGEALLVGEAINFPIFFRVRKRNNHFSDNTPNFEEMAENFKRSWSPKEYRKQKI